MAWNEFFCLVVRGFTLSTPLVVPTPSLQPPFPAVQQKHGTLEKSKKKKFSIYTEWSKMYNFEGEKVKIHS